MPRPEPGPPGPVAVPAPAAGPAPLADLMVRVARGEESAFEKVFDQVAGVVLGVVRSVLRDPGQSEEVAQEVMLEVWRTAPRFDAERGSARAWITTMAHRRAVDRVRSVQASRDREERAGAASGSTPYDEVSETVQTRLEAERVRRCLGGLTPRQREAVTMAYYQGHSYPEVASLLALPLGTVKTRMRDGLIRLRDCLGVGSDA